MPEGSFRLGRARRLSKSGELRLLQHEGRLTRSRYLSIRALSSAHPLTRIGLVVPRYQESAVKRNRLKRRLREIARIHILAQPLGVDLVIKASQDAYRLEFDALRREVLRLVERACERS